MLEVPEVIAQELEPERVDDDVKEEVEERELVVAEELEPERVDVDVKVEDEFMETNTEVSIETPQLPDEEDQPPWKASAGKSHHLVDDT